LIHGRQPAFALEVTRLRERQKEQTQTTEPGQHAGAQCAEENYSKEFLVQAIQAAHALIPLDVL
jgi:hypothetical protein